MAASEFSQSICRSMLHPDTIKSEIARLDAKKAAMVDKLNGELVDLRWALSSVMSTEPETEDQADRQWEIAEFHRARIAAIREELGADAL